MKINKNMPVMASGATGYVAGALIERLLSEGLVVHGTVRDLEKKEKLQYLEVLSEKYPGQLHYFQSDLLEEGSFLQAMVGCQVVFHTASPFSMWVDDPQKDLVDPAVKGTRNVLHSVDQTESVKKVVLTSSIVAICGDNADCSKSPGGELTESDWNTTSTLNHQPYSFSKVQAEREAWSLAEAQGRWQLVTINPSLVLGPGLNPFSTSDTFSIIKQMGDGTLRMGTANVDLGVVDVRDVAEAHFQGAFRPKAQGRYIVSGENTSIPKIAEALYSKYGDSYPIPKSVSPKGLVWLLGPFIDKALTRKYIAKNVNHTWKANNRKSCEDLGMSYRSMNQSVTELFQQMIDNNYFSREI